MKKLICFLLLICALTLALSSCDFDLGLMPSIEISEDGYWVINGEKTDVKAEGEKGEKGDKGDNGKDAVGTPSKPTTFTVTFDTQCSLEIPSQEVACGMKATEPTVPKRSGYKFEGWFVGDEKWSFIGYSVTENITLTAKWTIDTAGDVYEGTRPVPLPNS